MKPRSAWIEAHEEAGRTTSLLAALLVALLLGGCALALGGCASFHSYRGRISLPYREPVLGSSLTVTVRVMEGDSNPFCMLPDAANEIDCVFSYGYLEGSPGLVTEGGYRFLSFDTARRACSAGVWSLGSFDEHDVLEACARALLQHRWIDDRELYVPEPGASE